MTETQYQLVRTYFEKQGGDLFGQISELSRVIPESCVAGERGLSAVIRAGSLSLAFSMWYVRRPRLFQSCILTVQCLSEERDLVQ